jgi:hypothetical protein
MPARTTVFTAVAARCLERVKGIEGSIGCRVYPADHPSGDTLTPTTYRHKIAIAIDRHPHRKFQALVRAPESGRSD